MADDIAKAKAKKLLGAIISSVPAHHLSWHLAPEETQKAERELKNKYVAGADGKPEYAGKEPLPEGVRPCSSYIPTLEDLSSDEPEAKERIGNLVTKLTEALALLKA